jgi:hypothetical protein
MSTTSLELTEQEAKALCYVFEAGYREVREQGAFMLRSEIAPLEKRIVATLNRPSLELSDAEAGTLLVVVERGHARKRQFIDNLQVQGRAPLEQLKRKLRRVAGLSQPGE